ncbi:MAG: single-stranded-DNA-specific exonuclease RecJ [Bacteroidales bacterium]|nr:single-stranded-DNA-specific exonuclease RecJ [Bacteroidales bacterium]MCF8456446.1 single-stranded-DNA-specific exonuclease RecJ [Bacteroidales bacterium]
MEKVWKIKPEGDEHHVDHLARSLNIDHILANLLVQRGIRTYAEAKSFFRPELTDLHDPFLMKDMDKAVKRIKKALDRNEKILIYGDYDVDGTTSVALVYAFLKDRYQHLDYYIPDRYSQGYGISFQGIEYAISNNIGLIISLDCGIKAVEKIAYAKRKGVDFIVCDHHTPGDTIPDAVAVLDPKRLDCDYPFKHLSGCGVGFKLIQAYAQEYNIPFYELERHLDLVCVSIASDIVPITGENRVLAHFGLQQLNGNPSDGLKATIQVSNLEGKEITISDIVFKIGPRINAAGRMESGRKSVDLLISGSKEIAAEVIIEVNNFNDARKDLDRGITQEALEMIERDEAGKNKKSTVLYRADWHKGVIGIVASRLIETYYRPTVIMTESNGFATGSARTVEGYDLYQAVEACSDLLENFGGHTYAAGLTMKIENVPEFTRRFEEHVARTISAEQMIPQIEVDSVIKLSDITPKFYRILKQFAPFGPDNMSPVFVTQNVIDWGTGKMVGKNEEHLKLDLMQGDNSNLVIPAIAFNQSEHYEIIHQRIPFHVCYTLIENEFRGKVNLQLMVRDIKMEY